jgi:hypothetical protein
VMLSFADIFECCRTGTSWSRPPPIVKRAVPRCGLLSGVRWRGVLAEAVDVLQRLARPAQTASRAEQQWSAVVVAVLRARLVDGQEATAQVVRAGGPLFRLASKPFGVGRRGNRLGDLRLESSYSSLRHEYHPISPEEGAIRPRRRGGRAAPAARASGGSSGRTRPRCRERVASAPSRSGRVAAPCRTRRPGCGAAGRPC